MKNKKALSLVLSAGMLFSAAAFSVPAAVYADVQLQDSPLSYENNGYEIKITACDTSYSGEVKVPSEIDGLPVTVIGEGAFKNCFRVKKLELPETLVRAEHEAFFNMIGLDELTIPKNVSTLGNYAIGDNSDFPLKVTFESADTNFSTVCFDCVKESGNEKCKELTLIGTEDSYAIKFAKGWKMKYKVVGEETASSGKKEVTADGMAYNVYSDHAELISSDKDITGKVVIPSEVEGVPVRKIGESAFTGRHIDEVVIPVSVREIGQAAFASTDLKKAVVPYSVTKIAKEAFISDQLESVIILNERCEIADDDSTIANKYPLSEGRYVYGGVITAPENSTAETYAKAWGYEFKELGLVEADDILYGDANANGEVDLSDAVMIMQSISNPAKFKLTNAGAKAADVTGGGDGVTNKDALAIQRFMLGLVESLPEK